MIHQLSGTLISASDRPPHGAHIVLDVNGVGYKIITHPRTLAQLPEPRSPLTVHTHTVVAETVLDVVGFITPQERDLFCLLIQASGVGVKVALAILSELTVADVIAAVVSEQHKILSSAKGVGPKLAQKLVLELREKITTFRDHRPDLHAIDTPGLAPLPTTNATQEAKAVLASLGYQPIEIHKALEQSLRLQPSSAESAEVLLQQSLQWLATRV